MPSCDDCKVDVPAANRFCGQCGARMVQSSTLPDAASALRRSERKVVTVLFADIKGSLSIVAGRDPEAAAELLGLAVTAMSNAVRQYGGMVNQVMGDGIMALFGAPFAVEDHATRACLAAIEIREAMQHRVRPRLLVRMGLASGEVVVRAVPGDVGLHYSAAGEVVHLASRMEQGAEPDQILLSQATCRLAGRSLATEQRTAPPLKGLSPEIPVFALLGRASRSAEPEPAWPAARTLVGRERELARLNAARQQAERGQGLSLHVTGEAGTGKSRLLQEFVALYLPKYWSVCRAEAVSHRRTSHAVTAELLQALLGIRPEHRPAERQQLVRETVGEFALAPLSGLLDLEADGPDWAALDSWRRRELMLEAAVAAIAVANRQQALAVIVEDAHWLDPESAEMLQRLSREAAGKRLLVIVTERRDNNAEPWPGWKLLPIPTLDEAETLSFLRDRLLPGPDIAAFERKLIAHTHGNPLFLEECLQALLETGTLTKVGSAYRLVAPVQVLRVPTSLRGLLDERVDRLSADEKDVLQAAAVVGKVVPHDLLQRATGLDKGLLSAKLRRLVEAGFLVEGDVHAFRHGLIHDSAYRSTLLRRRVIMHGAVLDALEQRPNPATDALVDLLADHAMQAERWPKAVTYAQRAASRAFNRYANQEALHYYQQALAAAAELPAAEGRDDLLQQLHLHIRGPLFRLGHIAALCPHLDEAVRLARDQTRHDGLGEAYILRSHVNWLCGDVPGAMADIEQALTLAEHHDDLDLQIRARYQRGLVALSRSDNRAGVADMAAVADHLALDKAGGRYGLDQPLAVTALAYTARMHAAAGALDQARQRCNEAQARAKRVPQRHSAIFAEIAESVVSLAEGRTTPAMAAAKRAHALCREADMRLMAPIVSGILAMAQLRHGQPGQALLIAQQAVHEAEQMGLQQLQSGRLAILAQVLLALDQPQEALDVAREALTQARRAHEAGVEAELLVVMADALEQLGQDGETERIKGETLARRLGLHSRSAGLPSTAGPVAG